jgi:hypothetical protein
MATIRITENQLRSMIAECVETVLNEDMTRGQVEDTIEDYTKTRDFEKRVHNIVVDTLGDFIENMWAKKSFWKTMVKKR